MLNNETWLAHSDLFKHHWIVETKHWVRSLGWFTDFIQTVKDADGWAQAGDKELTAFDYVDIIDAKGSERKLYRCSNGITWEHISGPVVFVVRKDAEQVFIAGWAGEKKVIEKMKKESDDPWEWSDKMIIEVDPIVALHTLKVRRTAKKDQVPVFFVSNGENNADENWKHLVKLCPRAVRIDGIDGRRKMFHRCVDLAGEATQFFVVTGKNYITDASVFDYPVETISDAHIIFHAKNMSNRLQYEAWRTAFRETVKLTVTYGDDAHLWLDRWLSFAEGQYSDWVLKGAKEGHEYAEQHRDNKETLKNTVDWNWLHTYFEENHGPQ